MNILVTGANGFIGSALCKSLLKQGHQVRAVTRVTQSFLASEIFCVDKIDDSTNWQPTLQNIDVVIHLAARAHILHESAEDPLSEFRRVNTAGTLNLARQAAAQKVKRFIYVSSIGVNGNQTEGKPFSEADFPKPTEPYAISKWEAEQTLRDLSNIEWVIIRPPLVYGPGCKGNFLRLLRLTQSGIPLPLGSIHNQRSFIYIENLVDALSLCINHPHAAGQIFLICDDETISTAELIQKMAYFLKKPARLFPLPIRFLHTLGKMLGKEAEIAKLSSSLIVDNSKIKKELNWKPRFSLAEGLKATVEWYQFQK